MARFTTRVELHHTHAEEDYNKLHRAMEVEGVSRTAKLNGLEYHLPLAEDNRTGEYSTDEIVASAKRAAVMVSPWEATILVTKADGMRGFSGLQLVKKVPVKKSSQRALGSRKN